MRLEKTSSLIPGSREPPSSSSCCIFPRGPRRIMAEQALTACTAQLVNPLRLFFTCGRGPEEGGVGAIRQTLRRLPAEQRGATAIEYGLIAALIVIAMMGGLSMLGGGA